MKNNLIVFSVPFSLLVTVEVSVCENSSVFLFITHYMLHLIYAHYIYLFFKYLFFLFFSETRSQVVIFSQAPIIIESWINACMEKITFFLLNCIIWGNSLMKKFFISETLYLDKNETSCQAVCINLILGTTKSVKWFKK